MNANNLMFFWKVRKKVIDWIKRSENEDKILEEK